MDIMRSSSITAAAVGAALWLSAPLLPFGSPPRAASLEHVFLLFPLVVAPLALSMLASFVASDGRTEPLGYRVARLLQPFASLVLLAAFLLPAGPTAGRLALPWLVTTLAVAAGLGRARKSPSLLAAHVLLPVGGVHLLHSRMGIAPPGVIPLMVFMAAIHVPFSGFALQILVEATGRALPAARVRARAVHRGIALVAAAAIPFIAAGHTMALSALKFLGVISLVTSTLALAGITALLAVDSPRSLSRSLLFVSAGAVAVAMVLAGIYGIGEVTGTGLLGLPLLARVHGPLNAVGFVLCGLLGHILGHVALRRSATSPDRELPRSARASV